MNSPFETAPATAAIPINFATKATWDAISKELPPQAQQFAQANDFTAKPGKCLILPCPRRPDRAGGFRARGCEQQIPRSVPGRRAAGAAAAGRLSLCQCAA